VDEFGEAPLKKEKDIMLGKPTFLRLMASGYYHVSIFLLFLRKFLKIGTKENIAVYFPDQNIARVSVNVLTRAADVLLHLEKILPDFSRTLFKMYKPEGGSQRKYISINIETTPAAQKAVLMARYLINIPKSDRDTARRFRIKSTKLFSYLSFSERITRRWKHIFDHSEHDVARWVAEIVSRAKNLRSKTSRRLSQLGYCRRI